MEFLFELIFILNQMAPFLLLGLFVAGALHVFLPKNIIAKHLSRSGWRSSIKAAAIGIPLPLCSCGVIPTAMALRKDGASIGATISFLIATPQTGVDSIFASFALLGLPFAIIRPIVAFAVAIVGGAISDKVIDKNSPESASKETFQNYTHDTTEQPKRPFGRSLIALFNYGFVEMLQDLGKWLTAGLIVAAAITLFVPPSLFEIFNDYYILNILAVLLLSIPMYICSTGSIPIALSLLMMGVSPGAALVFLMAGPATNVATITVLNKVLGAKATILYLMSIIIGAITFAIAIDFLLPAEWFAPRLAALSNCAGCRDEAAWWQIGSSILFVALLANAYIQRLIHGHTHSHDIETKTESTEQFKVEGMRCNHCKANVERSVSALHGVSSATADLNTGMLVVTGLVDRSEICKAVRALGFEIE